MKERSNLEVLAILAPAAFALATFVAVGVYSLIGNLPL